jgi:hypothetical protein
MIKNIKTLIVLPVIIVFGSCLGLNMNISLRANGSGRIAMEYRIPSAAENLGRLDGNQNWQIIPVGRADWDRTVSRVNGVRLVSFSSRERQQEIITNVTLDFDNIEALLNLIDPTGTNVSYNGSLNIILNKKISSEINPDLLELVQQVSSGKTISISFSVSGAASRLTFTNGEGIEIPPPETAKIVQEGRKVSFTIDTGELFNLTDGLGLLFSW